MLSIGLMIGAARAAKVRESMKGQIDQSETDYQRLAKQVEREKSEMRQLRNFLVTMPEFARQINTNHEYAKVAPMIVGILDRMFSPRQIVVFFASNKRTGELILADSKGVALPSKGTLAVRMSEGRIGWVAEHKVAMQTDDFAAHARAKWAAVQEDPPGMKLELYAPMVHLDQDQKETLYGVVAIGGIEARQTEEKKMIKMVADLGSSAIFNTKLIAEINNRADKDGLTLLLNKSAFKNQLGVEIVRCEKERSPLAVFILDVDHFKHYNDTNGHLAGDEVLRNVGRVLHATVRAGDIVARYGGEEFIVAMPDTDAEGAFAAADKIRKAIEDASFHNQENQPLKNLTVSGGIAVLPADGRSTTDLIEHADQGLYESKRQGRNRVTHVQVRGLGDHSFSEADPTRIGT